MCRKSRVSSPARQADQQFANSWPKLQSQGDEKEATGLGESRSMERQAYARGSIANFFIRDRSVVRLMPMRAAAPSAPPTRPLDSVSA